MTTKATKSNPKKKETLIYCGPTLDNGNLQQYSLFQGELPVNVKKHLTNKAVKELFIEPSQLPRVKKNIGIPGTLEYQLYLNALNYAKGGK